MIIQDTLKPYKELEYSGIQYTNCRDYQHICRYKGLRQVIHNYNDIDTRFTALETVNVFSPTISVVYHTVGPDEENRIDLLAYKYLGSANYAWVISYLNKIEDGYTIHSGQVLAIPTDISTLFNQDEILGNVNALKLNLGTE